MFVPFFDGIQRAFFPQTAVDPSSYDSGKSEIAVKFERAVHLVHTIDVSDRRLRKLTDHELDQVVTELFHLFPFSYKLGEKAPRLHKRIELYRRAYLDIANAIRSEKTNFVEIESVRNLVEEGSFYLGSQLTDAIYQLKRNAVLSMDNVYSFPERYPILARSEKDAFSDLTGVNAEALIAFMDSEAEIEIEKYSRFLRKKIAYFERTERGIVSVTWLKAAEDWIQSGGNCQRDLGRIVRSLPYGFVCQGNYVGNRRSRQTFREFVLEKTTLAFEEMLEVPLPDLARREFKEKIHDEKTRRDLVFYSRYPPDPETEELKGTPDAIAFLDFAKRFQLIKAKYTFGPTYQKLLLEWIFRWKMTAQQAEELKENLDRDPKPNLDLAIRAAQTFMTIFADAREFSRSAMHILLFLASLPRGEIIPESHKIFALADWRFFDCNHLSFPLFLKSRAYRNVPERYGRRIELALDRIGAVGKSPLFLKILLHPLPCDELDDGVESILNLGLREISSQCALEILLNLPNNRLYIRKFHDEFLALSSEEKLEFLRRKNDSFPKTFFVPATLRVRASYMQTDFLQGPSGEFLVLCKLTSPSATGVYKRFIGLMNDVQKFVGFPLKQDLAAKLFFFDLPLDPFEEMLTVFVQEREKLIDFFKKNQTEDLPEESRKRISGAISQFDRFCSEEMDPMDSEALGIFSALTRYLQSSIVCNHPGPLAALIGRGPEAGSDHHFVPFQEDASENRMICAGWRMNESELPVFDVNLIDRRTFRSSAIHVPFSTALPTNHDFLRYLGVLANHQLADLARDPRPVIPESFKSLERPIEEWLLELKSLFRRAIWEMASQEPFNMGPTKGSFFFLPSEGGNFSFHTLFRGPEVNSHDFDQNVIIHHEMGIPLEFEIEVLQEGFSRKVRALFNWNSLEEGVKVSLEACGIHLNVLFPHHFMEKDEDKRHALNWQIVWLKAIIFQ